MSSRGRGEKRRARRGQASRVTSRAVIDRSGSRQEARRGEARRGRAPIVQCKAQLGNANRLWKITGYREEPRIAFVVS
ncbi:unnamed protein product [Soboliphyme baturini]|uniref:Uncharacterized protein n=1 Tax=Soboliphyme baturini TaxID=241478 RepID=A0A183J2B4_9BILA|nr:unnamed protein product [Soboliphyme baturini]